MNKLFFILLLVSTTPASAAVITVEKDGSGDYTVIQDAVNAAASGDTIRIGPGRFFDGEIVSTPGWTELVQVLVRQDELTLIGSDSESTIIGPDVPYYTFPGMNYGVESGSYWGSNLVRLSHIGFENLSYAARGGPATDVIIDHCRFENNSYQVAYVEGGDIKVLNSDFKFEDKGNKSIFVSQCDSVEISDCRFDLPVAGSSNILLGLSAQSTTDVLIRKCVFTGGRSALKLTGNGLATVDSCTFSNQTLNVGHERAGMLIQGGHVIVKNTVFELQENAIMPIEHTSLELYNVQILDVSSASIYSTHFDSLIARNCSFAHGPQYAIWQVFPCDQKTGELPHFDLTNNEWGTTDADEIASLINTCSYIVDYIPYIGQEVAVDQVPFGSVKAMFRNAIR